jgi:hypothetical protein|tara:strand:- start:262 stop:1578 length:1317 start_codon:yes stop_codon:yes gene_type:complete
MKKFFLITVSIVFTIIIVDLIGNLFNLKPRLFIEKQRLWMKSNYTNLYVGWYTYDGADDIYENEIHKEQTNGFLTRGKKPDNKIKNNIILIGSSGVETNHRLNEMPENYLRNYLSNTNVISFGSWGWGTDQQYIHLKKYVEEIKPSHVILWFEMNDIQDNKFEYGFLGPKPTFSLKKDKNNNYYLSGPNKMPGKNYFEYSYSYRLFNKLKGKLKLKYYRSYFDDLITCENNNSNNYVNKDELLYNYYNEKMYEEDKAIRTHFEKPRRAKSDDVNTFPSFKEWKKNKYSNFLGLDKIRSKFYSEEILEDPLIYNRLIISKETEEGEILTNKLLLKIQDLTNKHQASFHIMYVLYPERYKSFKDDKDYRYCFKNREFIYSNEAFDQKLNRVTEGINNVFINSLDGLNIITYDLFVHAHPNTEGNKFLMKKLSEYIKKFDN